MSTRERLATAIEGARDALAALSDELEAGSGVVVLDNVCGVVEHEVRSITRAVKDIAREGGEG